MSEQEKQATLAGHLEYLQADLDDVVAMLTVHHDEGGDIHPEALPKAEKLQTSLRDVIRALMARPEPLAMTAADVWAALTIKHRDHDSGIA